MLILRKKIFAEAACERCVDFSDCKKYFFSLKFTSQEKVLAPATKRGYTSWSDQSLRCIKEYRA